MVEKTGKRSKGNITKESKRVEEGERAGEESLELELHLELLPKAKKSPSNTKVEEMKVQLRLSHNFLFFPPLSTSLSFKQVVLLTFPPSPHHFHLSTSPPSLYTTSSLLFSSSPSFSHLWNEDHNLHHPPAIKYFCMCLPLWHYTLWL